MPAPMVRQSRPGISPTGRQLKWGLAAAGAASVGIGLVLLTPRKPKLKGKTAWTPMTDGEFRAVYGEAARRVPVEDPPPPLAAPAPAHRVESNSGTAQPWWAITAAEQEAIRRWDASLEKELLIEDLPRWLDANADALPRVDVELLKKKLSRDV
jgi:hypothetical protein